MLVMREHELEFGDAGRPGGIEPAVVAEEGGGLAGDVRAGQDGGHHPDAGGDELGFGRASGGFAIVGMPELAGGAV